MEHLRIMRDSRVQSDVVLSIPSFLLPLMLLNLSAHLALSGGRVAGSIFALKSGASEFSVGVLLALYALLPMLTALRVGRWVDRAGAFVALKIGVGCLIIGTLFPMLFLTTWSLFISAGLVGYGFNVVSIALQNSVGRVNAQCAPETRLANFGWFAMSHSVSSTLGPFLAGVLIDAVGYRTAFAFMLLSGAFALAITLRNKAIWPLPLQRQSTEISLDFWTRLGTLLATPEMRRIYAVSLTISIVWDLFLILLPVLGHRLNFSASVIGIVFALFALGTFAVRFATTWLSQRYSEWEILRAALIAITLSLAALPFVHTPVGLMLVGFMLGAALGCGQPNMLSLLHSAAPDGRSGEAVGLRSMVGNASSVSVPMAFGASVALFGVTPLLLIGALIAAVSLPAAHKGARQIK